MKFAELSDLIPAAGEIMRVEIELPANHRFGPKCIHCQAVVVRVAGETAPGGGLQLALSANQMQFRAHAGRDWAVSWGAAVS